MTLDVEVEVEVNVEAEMEVVVVVVVVDGFRMALMTVNRIAACVLAATRLLCFSN